MANKDYLDELDALLDTPGAMGVVSPPSPPARDSAEDPLSELDTAMQAAPRPASAAREEQANITWANVIEQASNSLQVSAQTVQDAVQKNIDLAKTQQEGIRDLSDAASGWRHATRQAVEEVTSAKKHVLILTVISGVIAVVGFSTTIGVMLQSRAGLASMSNAVLENVDDHQKLVSRTLTLKMDELAATIERMENQLDQMDKGRMGAAASATLAQAEPDQLVLPIELPAETEGTPATASSPEVPPASTPVAATETAPVTQPAPADTSAQLSPLLTQLQQDVSKLQVNFTAFEQKWTQSDASLNKQLAQLPGLLDKFKVPTATTAADPAAKAAPVVVQADNKPVMDQLARLRQELADLRQLQGAMRDQMNQLLQKSRETVPYQYRSRDVEGYPR